MNYAQIKYCDIANGPGVRTSLFVSGCTRRCKNCFNEAAWDFNYGVPFTKDIQNEIIESCKEDYVTGLTLLGGEPMEKPNREALLPFVKEFKKVFPQKTVWCYSGYTCEQLMSENILLLDYIDVLVDGEFIEEQYDISLRFCGSSNQRIIDMNKTRENGEITLWHDNPIFESHSFEQPQQTKLTR